MLPLSVVFREVRNGISWLSAEAMIPKRADCRVDYPQAYFVQNRRYTNSFCLNKIVCLLSRALYRQAILLFVRQQSTILLFGID